MLACFSWLLGCSGWFSTRCYEVARAYWVVSRALLLGWLLNGLNKPHFLRLAQKERSQWQRFAATKLPAVIHFQWELLVFNDMSDCNHWKHDVGIELHANEPRLTGATTKWREVSTAHMPMSPKRYCIRGYCDFTDLYTKFKKNQTWKNLSSLIQPLIIVHEMRLCTIVELHDSG